MRAQYEYGRGLMLFIPPTESQLATEIIELIIARLEDETRDPSEFYDILKFIAEDRRARQ